MKKIPTLFKRDPTNMRNILREPNPSCQWVIDGEGVATRKYDGTCCLVKDGELFKRRELKRDEQVPDGFVVADYDEVTGKTVGWVHVDAAASENKWHVQAFRDTLPDGTYELVGPKINGNHEHSQEHVLVKHDHTEHYPNAPRTFDGLKEWLADKDIEGLVWHHSDGRMAQIKKRDFGLRRN